jgi:TRAP-type C4-dicarboxylate transport system substrate-binding protein
MLRRTVLTAAAIVAGASLCTGAAIAQTAWNMPTGYAPANFHTVNNIAFAEAVGKATGGKLAIKVHPNASLYKMLEIKRAVQQGQVPLGEVLMVTLANENSAFSADGLPFLATNYDDATKLWKAQRPVIEKLLEDQGLMLLYAVPWPPQGMFVPRPINSTGDMAGLAWRAYDRGTARIGEIVKAKSVTIQAAEVAQALASGRINSQISSAQSGIDYKIWESVKHFYDIQAWLPKNMIIANRKAFGELAPDVQKALLAEAAKAEQAGWASSRRTAESTKQTLRDNGMTVHTPGAQLKAELDKIGQQLITEWSADASPQGKAVLEAFRKQ